MTWEIWVLVAILGISIERVINRYLLADTQDYWEHLIAYNVTGVLAILISGKVASVSAPLPIYGLLALSGVLWLIGCIFSFKADQREQVGLTSLLAQAQLIFVFAGGILFLGEPLSRWKLFGAGLILLGLGNPRALKKARTLGARYKLVAVVFFSVALLIDKKLTGTIDAALIALSGFGVPLLFATVVKPGRALGAWSYVRATRGLSCVAGVLSLIVYYAFVKAMSLAPISIVMPVYQLNLVSTLVLGVVLLGERNDLLARTASAALVLAGAIVIQW